MEYPLRAYSYYSIVESKSHYYITYSFYHSWDTLLLPDVKFDIEWKTINIPLKAIYMSVFVLDVLKFCAPSSIPISLPVPIIDFTSKRGDWNKNDMEGFLFVVKKDEGYGSLEAVFAQAHGFLQTYLTPLGKETFNARWERVRPFTIEPVEDLMAMESMNDNIKRIITTQEAQGHGAGCYPDWGAPSPDNYMDPLTIDKRHNNETWLEKLIEKKAGDDHIRYIPTRGEPEEPKYSEIKGKYTYCKYKLINVFEENGLWENRTNLNVFEANKKNFIGGHGEPLWSWYGSTRLNREYVFWLERYC
jgi:hypothetical protein